MKNKSLFILSFILLLSGCTTTLPTQMIGTINLFYNMLLCVGYLSIASVVLGGESKGGRLIFGVMWVVAVYCAI
ncbi:hypothetical protein, partial [Acinetobacter calcoaceticus]|uniref:hypothetical protein n=1 Tax=Acinetobacter calcoaceticus TaxID=471 RepID=UPI001C069CB0